MAQSRQPLFFGIDRLDVPATPAAPGTKWLRLLYQHSTFRILGAYLQFQDQRHWHDSLTDLMDDGWGVGGIFLGLSRESFVRKEVVGSGAERRIVRHFDEPEQRKWRARMTKDAGQTDARTARGLALTAHYRPGAILWFDNEDPSDLKFEDHEIDYYRAFFTEISSTAQNQNVFRPGLYAHPPIAEQLLKIRPDLHIWEVAYDRSTEQRSLPAVRRPSIGDNRLGLDAQASNSVLRSFVVAPIAPATPWVAWPLWRQFEGSNQGQIPQVRIPGLDPLVNWDFNSSLVRDPSDHVATPRLKAFALGNTAFVARLDDLDPEYNAAAVRIAPRRGRLRLYASPAFNAPVELAYTEWLHPASPIVLLESGFPELIVMTALGEFLTATQTNTSATQTNSGWTAFKRIWSEDIVPAVRFPYAFDACRLGDWKHLFFATSTNQLSTSRKRREQADYTWGDRTVAGGANLKLHPFAFLASCTRANTLHVIAINDASLLVALEWTDGSNSWPMDSFSILATTPVIPSSVTIASPSPTEVVVVAVGTDMQPLRFVYRATPRGSPWSPGVALGANDDKVLTHCRLSLTVIDARTLELIATGSDGSPVRYTLTADSDWTSARRNALLVPALAGAVPLFVPNPHGDISSVRAPARRETFTAFCGLSPGSPAALLSLVPGSAIRLVD